MSVASLCSVCFCVFLCVCVCTGHFVVWIVNFDKIVHIDASFAQKCRQCVLNPFTLMPNPLTCYYSYSYTHSLSCHHKTDYNFCWLFLYKLSLVLLLWPISLHYVSTFTSTMTDNTLLKYSKTCFEYTQTVSGTMSDFIRNK